MDEVTAPLFDTSIFIGQEAQRPGRWDELPPRYSASIITYAELTHGVHAATDMRERTKRMETLAKVDDLDLLEVDRSAAAEWALLKESLREQGRRMPPTDMWIAAIAKANDIPVYTQDGDFDVLAELGLLEVHRI